MIIPDDKLNRFIHTAYNVWFNKWKHKTRNMSDKDWECCIAECVSRIKQGEQYPVVLDICKALLNELEERFKENDQA